MKPMNQFEIQKQYLLKFKNRLDSVSPSFCLAKWLFLRIHLLTGKTQSCYHVPYHFVDEKEIQIRPSALHNTSQKKKERKQMMEGKKPKGCSYCWHIEESGNHYSDRHYQSKAPWAVNRFDEVVEKGSEYEVIPSYVELNLSNSCNFKCSYCSPELSSSWVKEIKEYGPFPTIKPHNDLNFLKKTGSLPISSKEENSYTKAFWKWWPELYPKLKVFRLTGGEPLVDHNTFKLLDYIVKHPNPELELAFTTNLCPPLNLRNRFKERIEAIIKDRKVRKVKLFPSIDSWGPQAEYIRFGLKIKQFEENVEFFNKDLDVHTCFIVIMNALSVFNLKNLLKKILEWQEELNDSLYRKKVLSYDQISVNFSYLRRPLWQTLQVLPLEMTTHYLNESLTFMKNNLIKSKTNNPPGFSYIQLSCMQRLLDVIKRPISEKELIKNRIDFYKFFKEHDRRRKTNFLKTFPELKDFWLYCKELSQERDESQIKEKINIASNS